MLAVFYKEDGSLDSSDFEATAEGMLDLIKAGDWDCLANMPVGYDAKGAVTCHWKDNQWVNSLWVKGTECGLSKFITNKTNNLSSEIINEIKSLTYIMIYIAPKMYAISSIANAATAYKKSARYLFTRNIHTFAGLTDQVWIDYHRDVIQTKYDNPSLNNLREYRNELPFSVQLIAPQAIKHEHKQSAVVPERLYLEWGQKAEKTVQEWIGKQARLSRFIAEQIALYESAEQEVIELIRTGKISSGCIYSIKESDKRKACFLSELEEQGIPLVDNNENALWMPLFKKHDLWINSTSVNSQLNFRTNIKTKKIFKPKRTLEFDGKKFKTFEELIRLLTKIKNDCIYLIFTLSGMRANELEKLTPEYGAQTVSINGHDVHLFHTGQQKIVVGYQAKKDVFVTTELGHQAYNLLNAIYEPFLNKMMGDKAGKRPFVVSLEMRNPRGIKPSYGNVFADFSSELTKADVENLKVSEYGSKKFDYKEGDEFSFTSHMGRRSLAYYLVALELCGFPQIKQQFSHLSLAMSIYYANNASRKNKLVMYTEIKDEREAQQALLLLRLKERAAKQQLSGGKGESWNIKGDKVMSFERYKKLVSDGDEFVTAVAPGLYCTNRNCCKTAQLSLVHDVSCGTSIVEHTAWVELQRATSINLLESLHNMGELTVHDVSKEMMNIRAAEVMINKHLGAGSIAEYKAPEIARQLLFYEAS